MRARVACVVAVATGLGLAGCSGGDEAGPVDIPAAVPPVTSINQALQLPLAKYALPATDVATIYNGAAVMTNACLARFGVPPAMQPTARRGPSDLIYVLGHLPNPLSQEVAQSYGLRGEPKPQEALGGSDDDTVVTRELTAREKEILSGFKGGRQGDGEEPSTLKDKDGNRVPEEGCSREGFDKLGTGFTELTNLVMDGSNNSWNRMKDHPRYQEAVSAWQGCMKAKGYDVSDPFTFAEQFEGKPEATRRKAALDDGACLDKTNLPGISYAIDKANQQQFIDDHAAQFTSAWDGAQKMLTTARAAIAKGQP